MTEEEIKQATCQVLGEDESGTGWLIAADQVLTAYHCVEASVRAGGQIKVLFGIGSSAVEHTVAVGAHDEDLDVCLLQLAAPLDVEPIPIDVRGLRPGEKWFAFGYPVAKLQLGHIIKGEVQQVLTERAHGVDLDLSVEPGTHLSDYRGLSGSALVVGSVCKGLLRLNVDSAIGALSLEALKPFLEANDWGPDERDGDEDPAPFGTRPAFDALFEAALTKKRGGYVFLDGSHGVGKSTYCREFRPKAPELDRLGVYAFTDTSRGSTPAHQAQPEVFFDWANSLLSARATGKPARLMELSYSQLIDETANVLQGLASRCTKAGKVGVLFIDGINEAAAAGDETLKRFINLLPQSLPEGLVMVITGVGLDAIAGGIGAILQGADRLTLPTLDRDIQYGVCINLLHKDKVTTELVATLCDRALGHPLYLRYLADLVNSGATQGDIAELPVFSGSIQDYYGTIWANLVPNDDVINLLGIIARLRWGIPPSTLTTMLTSAEAGVFTSTLLRVRHLLANAESTAIYHPSFSEYVVHKTSTIADWVHGRLAEFCGTRESGDYGTLNKVYHGLRGGLQPEQQAIQACQQTWVDDSVLLGVEPDVLLADIEDTLASATKVGTATDIVRLLLLSQRLTFRYNVLFTQTAELVALALVSLGKTEAALRHVVRNGRLVVSSDEAFAVANALTQHGSTEQALNLLDLVQREVSSVFEKLGSPDGVKAGELLAAVRVRLHGFSLAQAAGDDPPFSRFIGGIVYGILRHAESSFSQDEGDEILRQLTGQMAGASLCLKDNYRPFSQWGVTADVDVRHQLLVFLQTLAHAEMYCEQYGIALKREVVDLVLSDIEDAIGAELQTEDRRFVFTDTLIEAGAGPSLVEAYSDGVDLGDGSLPFYKKNRADPDADLFEGAMLRVRASYFLGDEAAAPPVQAPTSEDWEGSLDAIARAVAWSDGKARRATATNNQLGLDSIWSFIEDTLLPCFALNLESRVWWDDSYFIPEKLLPPLYARLTKLLLDCFPTKKSILLDAIERGFDVQLGLYNEGFRATLQEVLGLFIARVPEGPDSDQVFGLTLRWRDYVAANVENRLELVPELLQIVPLLVRLNAPEEALRTYQSVLSVSMGPGWYKEDQLSMMSGTLEALPATSPVPASSLVQVAGLLERATGEMTFQRFIRADKGRLIRQLCRRELFADAVRYFQHQSCGTLDELFAQATTGNLDRISTLVGMRFPGAALEEQAALLAVLLYARGQADWRLRWALLEVFQHGDERHLTDWGREYAVIITELTSAPEDLAQAKARIRSIVTSLNTERAWLLLRALVSALTPEARPAFAAMLREASSGLDARQIERLTSSFGLRDEPGGDAPVSKAEPSRERSSDPEAEMVEDERFYMPGTFGKRSAVKDADARLAFARSQAVRRNFSAAAEAAVGALQTLQAGGWSVWSSTHSGQEADRLIGANVQDADKLARLYGPLVIEERHTQRWAMATHLIDLVAGKVDAAQQAALLEVAIDHVREIVGEAASTAFAYIGTGKIGAASEALFELLLWTVDHPSWERRDGGAAMMLWLARADGDWLSKIARLAISMDKRNRADIASAVLDILSRENPVGLWQRIEANVDIAIVLEQCRHVGRYSVLMRVAERASKRGNGSAAAALKALQERFLESVHSPTRAHDNAPPRYVPATLYLPWRELLDLGVMTEDAFRTFAFQMEASSSPLTVDMARALESLVAEGGREKPDLATGRWASAVRYALSVALFQPMPASKLARTEAVLRAYNPGSLVEPDNGRGLLASLVTCLENGQEQSYLPSHGNLVFLDLQCFVEMAHRTEHVELVAHLDPPGPSRPPLHNPPTFKATELPRPGADEPISVCGRARPAIAYFGSISPAVPTPRFLELAGAQTSSTTRYHWRGGDTVTSLASSRRHEVALLAIERDALSLPSGSKLRWTLRINGETRAILTKY
ncbi:AVAST type 1 anti-phage system protease Avs1b [Roseateles amylovorans]|uniref:Serine protease n=1 Tax=Roseateles amylovorans TaxID=2978473 RepID=A0ABY6B6G4_9BURK|nr:AVAST type 1 anti-phage system protease Avs1b [Roseateles amylovorans]UXH80100.1 serine protease [Roseateles amylovorans]